MQDNQAFRALFTLPPVQTSTSTALSIPKTPAPKSETGDRELDAVLWLRDCIKTAHPVLIDKALLAFKQIKTPAKDLEDRYRQYVTRASNGHFAAVLMTFGFANLESLAKGTLERQARKDEAMSRFGTVEGVFADTPSEAACKAAVKGLRMNTAEATVALSLAKTCIETLNFFTKPIAFCAKSVKLTLQLGKPFLLGLQFAPKRFHILRVARVFQRFRPLSHALNKLDLAGLSMRGISDLAFQSNQKHTKMRHLRLRIVTLTACSSCCAMARSRER